MAHVRAATPSRCNGDGGHVAERVRAISVLARVRVEHRVCVAYYPRRETEKVRSLPVSTFRRFVYPPCNAWRCTEVKDGSGVL
mmetsp:Transcript_10824/g.30077  ORF Transcript_10824/g.30077 Transcript_10824/m.30077 type:complete len:83 (-) Transcript_10824:101-349(-)